MKKYLWIMFPIVFMLASVAEYRPPSCNVARARFHDSLTIYEYASIRTQAPESLLWGLCFAESSNGRNTRHPDPNDVGWFALHEDKLLRAERIWRWGEYDANDPQSAAIVAGRIVMHNYKYFTKQRMEYINRFHGEAMLELDAPMDQSISAYNQGISGYEKRGINQKYIDIVKAGMLEYSERRDDDPN